MNFSAYPIVYLMEGGARLINNYINQHGKRLYGLCLKLCVNAADADDLYQETWLKVLRNISKFKQIYRFDGSSPPILTEKNLGKYQNRKS